MNRLLPFQGIAAPAAMFVAQCHNDGVNTENDSPCPSFATNFVDRRARRIAIKIHYARTKIRDDELDKGTASNHKECVMKYGSSLLFAAILLGACLSGLIPREATAQASITVDQAVRTTWDDMRSKKSPQYTALKVIDHRSIVVEKTFDSSTSYAQFIETFPGSDCRYYLVDFRYSTSAGEPQTRLTLIEWSPETALTKSRAEYASVRDLIRKELPGIQFVLQARDKDDVSYENVSEQVQK